MTEKFDNPRTGQAEDVEYVVNPTGAVHSVPMSHPAVRVLLGGGDIGERRALGLRKIHRSRAADQNREEVIDRQPFAHGAGKGVDADEDRESERERHESGGRSHAQHPHDEQQQHQQLQRLKTAEGEVVVAARRVVHDLDQRAPERTEVRAVVKLRGNNLRQRAPVNGRELRERVTELHRDLEQQRSHHRGNARRVDAGEPVIVTTGICTQWDRVDPEVYVKIG